MGRAQSMGFFDKLRFRYKSRKIQALTEKYMVELSCANDQRRITAAENLGDIGAIQAIEPLMEIMSAKKEEVSMAAARALSKIKDDKVLEELVKALANPDKWLPARVAEVIIAHGQLSVPILLRFLAETDDPTVKANYIEILGEIKDLQSVPALISELNSFYPEVRVKSALALGNIKDKRAVENLIKKTEDKEGSVRAIAARSLGKIKDSQAIGALQKLLYDQEWNVRINAIEALGEFGPAAVVIFETLINEDNYPEKTRVEKILMGLKVVS